MMKPLVPLLFISWLLSSCATLLNSPRTTVWVRTNEPAKIIVEEDTLTTHKNKVKLRLTRSNTPVSLTAQTDSLSHTLVLAPKNSDAYLLNFAYNLGVGALIDRKSPKRYMYQPFVRIDLRDTLRYRPKKIVPYRKGAIDFHISLPHVNQFYFQPPEENSSKNNAGFLGYCLGLDYYHFNNQYFQLSASATTDFLFPFPAPVSFGGEYEAISSLDLSFSNNHKINRFSFGYGIVYAKNIWALRYSGRFGAPPPSREPVSRVSENLGLVLTSYYRTGPHFQIGLVYRPTFIRLRPKLPSVYEHLISIDFAWKIRLKR